MQWEYYPTIDDGYQGTIWTVAQSIYNSDDRDREGGTFAEDLFDDEAEARERFYELDDEAALLSHLEGEEGYFDTAAVLLYVREYGEDGLEATRDDYFEDLVVDEAEYSRR